MKTNATGSRKSTHVGECQICGRVQALPDALLSKHGYTTRWGFFSGVCHGSGHQPFELSCDLIAAAVEQVERHIKETDAEIAELEYLNSLANSGGEAWMRSYDKSTYSVDYFWERVKLVNFEEKSHEGFSTYSMQWVRLTPRHGDALPPAPHSFNGIYETWKLPTPSHWAHHLNSKYAAELRQTNAGRRDWVKWQQDRLKNWAPKLLQPRVK